MRGWSALLFALVFVASVHAAPGPFIAPAQTSGTIDVVLAPTEVVTAGTPRLVTFGMPFPRESITSAGLSTVRVLRNGVEIPAHVAEMTPWRHRSNAAIDGQSVRVARIQITYTFAATFPATETIQVAWGTTPRTLNVPALVNPRTACLLAVYAEMNAPLTLPSWEAMLTMTPPSTCFFICRTAAVVPCTTPK